MKSSSRSLRLDPDNPDLRIGLRNGTCSRWVRAGPAIFLEQPATHRNWQRAVDLAPEDARALTLAGHVRGFIDRRPDEALELHERALKANPNLPLAWCRSASRAPIPASMRRRCVGRSRQGTFRPTVCLLFSTRAPWLSCLLLSQYETSAKFGARAIELNPGFSSSYKAHLAALGHLGRRTRPRRPGRGYWRSSQASPSARRWSALRSVAPKIAPAMEMVCGSGG